MALPRRQVRAAGWPTGRRRRPWLAGAAALALLASCEAAEPVLAPGTGTDHETYTGPEEIALGGEGTAGDADAAPDRPELGAVPDDLEPREVAPDGANEAAATTGEDQAAGDTDAVAKVADAGDTMSRNPSEPAAADPDAPAPRPGEGPDAGSAPDAQQREPTAGGEQLAQGGPDTAASPQDGGIDLQPPQDSGSSAAMADGGDGGTGGSAAGGGLGQTRVIGGNGGASGGGADDVGEEMRFDQFGASAGEPGDTGATGRTSGASQTGRDTGAGAGGTVVIGGSREGEPAASGSNQERRFDLSGDGGASLDAGARVDGDAVAFNPAFYQSRDQVVAALNQARGGLRARVGRIGFEHGSARLDRADRQAVSQLARLYGRLDGPVEVKVVGHASRRVNADNTATARTRNRRMGERRATAVATALASAGVPEQRVSATSAGAEAPRYSELTGIAEGDNRRATVIFILP